MKTKTIAIPACVTVVCGALLMGQARQDTSPSAAAMETAAKAFLETLDEDQRQIASFKFSDEERLNWHFIPRDRKGLAFKDLEGPALKAAHGLVASGLSESGYEQTLNVMSLEEILYLLEGGDREERRGKRDPQKYYISIFGKPSSAGQWGWRVEGHHVSLNYTIRDGAVISSTPEFFGANPGTVDAGPGRAVRVLGPEEDIARQILKLCSEKQLEKVWQSKEAPRDLRGGGVAQPVVTDAVGITFGEMSSDQKELMGQLLAEYLKNMPEGISKQRRQQIQKAGMEKIHFAWWGSPKINEPHYYVVQGPTFIVEYNNVQNSANHVHSIWRNISGDFGLQR